MDKITEKLIAIEAKLDLLLAMVKGKTTKK